MNNQKRVSEVIARPARTLVQATPAYAVVEFVDAFLWNMTERQFGAAIVLLTLVISATQAAIENASGAGLLRYVPPTEAPVVDKRDDERGNLSLQTIVFVLVGIAAVVLIVALVDVNVGR